MRFKKDQRQPVHWCTDNSQGRGKRKYIMRFEIRNFFLEIGLSPLGWSRIR